MGDNFGMEFHTLKGYQMHNVGEVTESMEDYLEMIGRCMEEHGYVRVGALADKLNVRPSSVSKMVGRLRELGLVQFEKYGLITLTKKGMKSPPIFFGGTMCSSVFSSGSITRAASYPWWSRWSILWIRKPSETSSVCSTHFKDFEK